jgi:hypothetical protein
MISFSRFSDDIVTHIDLVMLEAPGSWMASNLHSKRITLDASSPFSRKALGSVEDSIDLIAAMVY